MRDMDDEQLQVWTTEHRLLLADTLEQLGEERAGDPTLCAGWDVRTLAGHLLQPLRVPSWRFLLTAARVRSMAGACDVHAARLGARPLAEVVAEIRATAPRRVRPWYIGAAGPYTDTCIHLRDLAEPQGLEVSVPVERWVAALDIITSPRGRESFVPRPVGGGRRDGLLDGLSLQATDADRRYGEGEPVRGTAEAVAMVVSGRRAYLDRVSGAGAQILAARLP